MTITISVYVCVSRWGRSDLNAQPTGSFNRSRIQSSPEGSAILQRISGARRPTGLDYDPQFKTVDTHKKYKNNTRRGFARAERTQKAKRFAMAFF